MTESANSRIIFVCGLSGAGKSILLNSLEDQDYYCIDNFPIDLLENFITELDQYPKLIAIGINARNQETKIQVFTDLIDRLRKSKITTEIVFLEADSEVLIKRYSETRRKHPFSSDGVSLHDAIVNEHDLLVPLAASADFKIDTSHTTVHDLREIVSNRIAGRNINVLSLQLISFGYKYGIPRDADFIFDVRCLPNPYWDKNLRDLTGKDRTVIQFMEKETLVDKMSNQLTGFFKEWLQYFEAENRSYLTIAAGCTGGRHRSVYIIEKLANSIRESGRPVKVRHRDL
jgi:UPF0042 nucleotide-binding protein